VLDVIPGASTVLVTTEPRSWDLTELAARLTTLAPLPAAGVSAAEAEIPVVYDGADLADVARLTGLDPAGVIARHQAAQYTVGWLGFSPGFGYLTGLGPPLSGVPRLDRPRQSVPAGSVAIAGGLSAVYPATAPGGWRLLGRTAARLWDPSRDPPALLSPGMRVRFRAVPSPGAATDPDPGVSSGRSGGIDSRAGAARPRPGASEPAATPPVGGEASSGSRPESTASPAGSADAHAIAAGSVAEARGGTRAGDSTESDSTEAGDSPGADSLRAAGGLVEVLRPGPLATIQDLGRPGLGHLGVPASGAADAASLRLANRLAGNPPSAAGVEFTLGRAELRFQTAAVVAVTGAPVRLAVRSGPAGREAEMLFATAFSLKAGSVLSLGSPPAGLRTYLAVRGGIECAAVLGSRSADLLSGLGPGPLRAGDLLSIGQPAQPAQLAQPARPTAAGAGQPAQPGTPAEPERPSEPGQQKSAPAGWPERAPGQPAPGQPAAGQPAAGQAASQRAADQRAPEPDRAAERAEHGPRRLPGRGEVAVLRVLAGPRDDWFSADAMAALRTGSYAVTAASNRTGLRLAGQPLPRRRAGELPSEGVVTGSLQVPPDGQPILLLADHQVTGGYPVIAVVRSADLGLAAQLRPGHEVRFELS
jgi:KipI family sensor histidine kinase inhibitor